jgi:dimethylglycine dehydrogenase
VTSGAYGYSVGQSLALGFVSGAVAGDEVEVMVLGLAHKAVILQEAPFDASGEILRG